MESGARDNSSPQILKRSPGRAGPREGFLKGKAASQSKVFGNEGAGHHRAGDVCSSLVQS